MTATVEVRVLLPGPEAIGAVKVEHHGNRVVITTDLKMVAVIESLPTETILSPAAARVLETGER